MYTSIVISSHLISSHNKDIQSVSQLVKSGLMNNKGLGIYRLLKHAIKDVNAGPFSATLPDPTCEISDQTRPDPPITIR